MVRGKPKQDQLLHIMAQLSDEAHGPPVHIFVLNNIFVAFVNDICLYCRTVYLLEWTPPGDITCSLQNPGSEFQFLPTWYTENGWYYIRTVQWWTIPVLLSMQRGHRLRSEYLKNHSCLNSKIFSLWWNRQKPWNEIWSIYIH